MSKLLSRLALASAAGALLLALPLVVAPSPAVQAQGAAPTTGRNDDHRIGVCHATGSATNPYVFIVVDIHAALAHQQHQDGRDIVGALSTDECPDGGGVIE
ncbi:MAG: hypothetical protein IRZ14_14080 [Chloroflexi bacterium]|nr:hypothetical protein [Chloroflexota bacterium]